MAACTSFAFSSPRPPIAYGRALWRPAPSFVAIDLRTLDLRNRARGESLSAVAAVRVEEGTVVDRYARLVRPRFLRRGPAHRGLAEASSFRQLWPSLRAFLCDEGQCGPVAFVAAHDAPFVSAVLDAACEREGLPRFELRYEHTASLARRVWEIDAACPHAVAAALGLTARPDDVLSTAEACADVVLAAWAA